MVFKMGERLKLLLLVAILGFAGGVVADLVGRHFIPWLTTVLPEVLSINWVLSGLAGAALTVVLVVIYAYVSPRGPGE